ncbi:hypothetical protein PNK_1450 [Candidatus Protochlamydia naegleriophila]|uniref:Glycosyltransferase 2-like domain-containing protein n=2 Tax=Candidatus Protochlamydia naegleriophila TaxID=389348 RepID=A0A0U5JH07_9BACT|nr:hypothetical protein PNK_1450 [Candidatus Protochlamydia naegleriophila]
MCYLYYIFIFCSFFVFDLDAQEIKSSRERICLNMIVKDETPVIERCLATVKPIIDYWVIVDTGSTDGTQQKIKEFMKDIPGELHERPWVNFAHNRNEALALAKGKADYVLLMDADDTLRLNPDFKMPDLNLDCYNSLILFANLQYDRPLLIKDALDWKWYGVLHEYLASTQHKTSDRLQGIQKIVNTDGNRSQDPQKYQKDAKLLEAALKEDPTNSRYVFYLAQSYKDAGEYESSLKQYEKRVEMGGWDQEIFYSKLQIARLQQMLNRSPETFIKSYYDAYHYRPSRVEPLYYLAKYYRSQQDHLKAYLIASIGLSIPASQDSLFVERWINDYDMQLELSVCAYWIGKYEECQILSANLLKKPDLPENVREVVEKNISFANAKLVERLQGSVKQL